MGESAVLSNISMKDVIELFLCSGRMVSTKPLPSFPSCTDDDDDDSKGKEGKEDSALSNNEMIEAMELFRSGLLLLPNLLLLSLSPSPLLAGLLLYGTGGKSRGRGKRLLVRVIMGWLVESFLRRVSTGATSFFGRGLMGILCNGTGATSLLTLDDFVVGMLSHRLNRLAGASRLGLRREPRLADALMSVESAL